MNNNRKIVQILILSFCCLSLTGCSLTSLPDSLILQNQRYPQYAEYLQGNDYLTYYIATKKYRSAKTYNFLHLQVYSSDSSSISRKVNSNGSVTIKGKSKKAQTYIRLTDNFTLLPGSYTIYDGHVAEDGNIIMFVNGYDEDGTSHRVAELPERGTFEVTEGEYSYYRVYVSVAGNIKHNRTIFPMLCYADSTIKRFYSPIFSTASLSSEDLGGGNYDQLIVFNITKEEFASIPYKDFHVFFNNLRYIYSRRYVSCTLVFEDGTGIQFEDCDPDKGIYGSLDGWYRTSDITGIVTDTGSYLTLCDENGNPLDSGQNAYGINGIKNE